MSVSPFHNFMLVMKLTKIDISKNAWGFLVDHRQRSSIQLLYDFLTSKFKKYDIVIAGDSVDKVLLTTYAENERVILKSF